MHTLEPHVGSVPPFFQIPLRVGVTCMVKKTRATRSSQAKRGRWCELALCPFEMCNDTPSMPSSLGGIAAREIPGTIVPKIPA